MDLLKILQANDKQDNTELRGITALFEPDRHRNIFIS